jgi:hypothetical protein
MSEKPMSRKTKEVTMYWMPMTLWSTEKMYFWVNVSS